MNLLKHNLTSPHDILLNKLMGIIGDQQWVEVTHAVPFGFNEVERKNISVNEFLNQFKNINNFPI